MGTFCFLFLHILKKSVIKHISTTDDFYRTHLILDTFHQKEHIKCLNCKRKEGRTSCKDAPTLRDQQFDEDEDKDHYKHNDNKTTADKDMTDKTETIFVD